MLSGYFAFRSHRLTTPWRSRLDALRLRAWSRIPKAIAVNGNGANGNDHHTEAIGPTVELVVDNDHHANGNGNGHHDEAPEPQQTLFSWAEFMAEKPVKPKRGNGKLQPATPSLFEWALSLEQQRETVGAGR